MMMPMPTTMLDPVRRSEEVFNVQEEEGWTDGIEGEVAGR